MSDQTTLPMSWMVIPLPIAASINPPKGKIEATESELAHFVPMACVQVEFRGIDVSTIRPLREVLKGYTSFQEGDVLFAKITPCMENGKLAVVPPLEHRWGFGSTEFHVLRASEIVLPKWIGHFVSQASVRRDAQRSMTGTAGQLRVPALWLNEQELPIPPLAEQSRIVAKIEELFSDLDAGVAALKRAKANLKRYRASVLKAAVEGKLTEQWRAKHPATEPASALLARILKERRLKWEADQLAKFAAVRKEPPKNWRDKYVEPTLPDTNGLPELPEGWCWTSLDSLCSVIADIDHNMPKSDQTGVKFLSAKDLLDDGTLNFTNNIKLISEADYVRLSRKVKPQRNDIIYSRIGARLGKSRLVETDERFLVSYSCCTIRPIVILPKFLARYLDCDFVLRRAISDAQSIGVPDLGLEKIKAFAVPLCSIEEQNEIVAEMEQKLSVISVAEKEIEHGMLRAARLRQSILKRAFEGKLVPQDPKDEPASALLERLRTSRTHDEANGTAATSKRTRAKIKESSGKPRTRIRRGPSSQNQQEE